MRRSWTLLVILSASFLYSEKKPEPVRVCLAMLENSSRHIVTPKWQRDQVMKALERTNASEDVKKGKVPRIEVVALESSGGPDPNVREKDCGFVLYTDLIEVLRAGEPKISFPPPGAVEVGTGVAVGDLRAYPPDYESATVDYQIMRAGNPEPWASGLVTAHDQTTEEALVSQLMDQVANRVASELHKPHRTVPQ